MFNAKNSFEMIYRGSKHSFKAAEFHKKCDDKGKFVLLAKSKEKSKIFGGFSDISLQLKGGR